jgi:hypothetical protein
MTFTEVEGWLAALRTLRRPAGRFTRRPGRRSAGAEVVETKTTRSISLRRARPDAVKKEDHGA